ncbi:hypothetical protein Rsub_04319 [Raphidocelis subcapitata]|uniref:Fibronectin type-III domain-containing protein n=1 Tax=Raphidocelis subcapitata TaxID=307507 RepID=A0A2V0NW73_9CHLO|nr:hypothetical protein Rsub_04319 [Raphidocelis subcapitata]|eukprot:GBF91579.1 hypothetical protein Rsub_04319 [Raphidocelis subcapitata]
MLCGTGTAPLRAAAGATAALVLAALLLTASVAHGRAGAAAGGDSHGPELPCVEEVPGPVLKLKARAVGETALTFQWLPPRGDRRRGDPCVDFYERTVVEAGEAPQDSDTATDPIDPVGREGEFVVTKDHLRAATNYRVTVRAVSARLGPGPATTAPVRTRGSHDDSRPPGAVYALSVREQPGSQPGLLVTWAPPRSGGWAEEYGLSVSTADGRRLVADERTDDTELAVTSGLRHGTLYEIRVTAYNRAGAGPAALLKHSVGGALAGGGGAGEQL